MCYILNMLKGIENYKIDRKKCVMDKLPQSSIKVFFQPEIRQEGTEILCLLRISRKIGSFKSHPSNSHPTATGYQR